MEKPENREYYAPMLEEEAEFVREQTEKQQQAEAEAEAAAGGSSSAEAEQSGASQKPDR